MYLKDWDAFHCRPESLRMKNTAAGTYMRLIQIFISIFLTLINSIKKMLICGKKMNILAAPFYNR